MDLEIIRTVLEVAKQKSFSAAAFSLPSAQSTVSRQVKAAEDELGVKIFDRSTSGGSRNVELTRTGREVVRAMIKVVDAYMELYNASGGADVKKPEVLQIGVWRCMFPPMGFTRLKENFFENYQTISLYTRPGTVGEIMADLHTRKNDAALFFCSTLNPADFPLLENEKITSLGSQKVSIGISENDPLAKKSSLRVEELREKPVLMATHLRRDVAGVTFLDYNQFRAAWRRAGIEKGPQILSVPPDMLDIRYKLTAEGKGVFPSYTPASLRKMEGVRYLPVEDLELQANYYLVTVRGRKERALKLFSSFFSQQLQRD